MTVYMTMDSPLGELLLVGEESATGVTLTSLAFPGQKRRREAQPGWRRDEAVFTDIVRQLGAYFAGELQEFEVDYASGGTPFQERVWAALETIPYGSTVSYGQLAERAGAPRTAVRAVAAAIGANPLLIFRPCHRVIGADGSLTGYAGGLARKERLLAVEGALQTA
ncbi:methylated-DNA--[protein]-cysteine S-methyltransferase [Microtetraspora sp. AC03309]|uniref:methylated-DNA--[protein]-cysteine S-methyltransferase n=1 Tax=Microtetraspora sp. AC03309 TaxID=2779376 RepID=UPI001E429ACD|nr:methylated-DNA--[protein]-cysteine S-methyltransferase [Microtetraspora sp. AC03309]MCC5576584.1 methylated-DNA--[protein]-cysteine S-methyltransferase [Microtetraspora sp. AC03309]